MCKGPETGRSLGLLRIKGPFTYVAGGQRQELTQARPGGGGQREPPVGCQQERFLVPGGELAGGFKSHFCQLLLEQ